MPARLRRQTTDRAIPERIRPVFRDREELPSAGNLGDKIEQALNASNALLVICSPASAQSHWVNQEILSYKRLHGEDAVFCLIVDGEPGSGNEHECFAPALLRQVDERGELSDEPAEPIAADARPGKDGKSLARLKLIAGLLGVGLDDLRQREQQRRQRRLLGITAASLAGMALTAFLAIQAIVARGEAEQRQQQAEGLIEFMLGDLKTELGKVGRLDALDATAQKALEYFAEQPEADLDDEALARRAEAFRAIGQIRMDRLEWDQALASNQLALQTSLALHQRYPESRDFLFELAQSEFWVGYVHLESGNPAAAQSFFENYLDHSEDLLQSDPDNPDWVMEVSFGHTNLAGIHDALGRHQAAIDSAAKGVAWNRRALRLVPGEDYYQEELANGLAWLASAQLRSGHFQAAAESRLEANELLGGLHVADPANMTVRQKLATSLRGEANARIRLGQTGQASALMNQSMAHFDALLSHDPTNELWSWWAQDTALDQVLMAPDIADPTSQLDPAALRVDWLQELTMRDFGEDQYRESRRLLAISVLMLLDQPLPACTGCMEIEPGLAALWQPGEPPARDSGVMRSLALTHLLLAKSGYLPSLDSDLANGLVAVLKQSVEDDPNLNSRSDLARLLLAQGRHEEADEVIQVLLAGGYRHPALIHECTRAGLCDGN